MSARLLEKLDACGSFFDDAEQIAAADGRKRPPLIDALGCMAHRDDWFPAEKLHRAAADGDMQRARELIGEKAPLDAFDDIGYTPLHHAAKNQHIAMVKLLLDAGANVNAREEETNSDTAIAVAAADSSPEMVRLLLERGADPTIPGWMGVDARYRADQRRDGLREQVLQVLREHAA